MSKLGIDVVDKVMNVLEKEFKTILDSDPKTYAGYKFILTNEQQFVKQKDKDHKNIYIVVKFLNGSQDYGKQRQPFALNAVSEYNSLGICQQFLMDFSEAYNLYQNYQFESMGEDSSTYSIKQTVSTVASISNFNEIYEGFRSVFYVSGTFLIGSNDNPVTKLEVSFNDGFEDITEEIQFISFQFSYDTQPDSQPFYDTNNFNRTINKIATLSVGFTMYAENSKFYNYCMSLIFGDAWVNPDDESETEIVPEVDKKFTLKVTFKNNPENPKTALMRLVSFSNVQELRDFPAASVTFLR